MRLKGRRRLIRPPARKLAQNDGAAGPGGPRRRRARAFPMCKNGRVGETPSTPPAGSPRSGSMPRSDVLSIALALLAVPATFLLSPNWGWVFLAAGLIALLVYFKKGRGERRWPRYIVVGAPLVLLAVVAVLLGWKATHRRIAPIPSPPPAADAKNAPPKEDSKDQPTAKTDAGVKKTPGEKKETSKATGTTQQGKEAGTTVPSSSSANSSVGTVNAGPCSVLQVGGTGNRATGGTCGPPAPEVLASQQVKRESGDPSAPWMTTFTINATGQVITGTLRLKCTGRVVKAGIGRINPFQFMPGSNGPDPGDPTVVVYELSPEPLSPGRLISVTVYSLEPVTVVSGRIGEQVIHFP